MKRIIKLMALALTPLMIAAISGCSGGSTSSAASGTSTAESAAQSSQADENAASPAEITAKIMEDIKFPSMAEVKAERLSDYYDISADAIESASVYICGSGAYPDELAVFRLKSSDETEKAKAALEKRIEAQTKTFEDYTPAEMYKLDGKNIAVKGNCIALIICADNAAAKSTFESMA